MTKWNKQLWNLILKRFCICNIFLLRYILMGNTVIVIVLSCALGCVLLGIILYCSRNRIRNGCGRIFRRKRKVHQITVPARPSGQNEIVLAVTQRRDAVSRNGSSVGTAQTTTATNYNVPESISNNNYQSPHLPLNNLVTRHHSFVTQQGERPTYFASDVPSPLVSLSSLQSLLMSSQVAIFNSSTERLSLSSQNQNTAPFQPISLLQQQQQLQSQFPGGVGSGGISPYSIPPSVSSSCGHLPQPSYFDEPPPSYQASMLIRKLRASDRGNRVMIQQHQHNNFNVDMNIPSDVRMLNTRRSCRM